MQCNCEGEEIYTDQAKVSIVTLHVGAGGELDSNLSCSLQRERERSRGWEL